MRWLPRAGSHVEISTGRYRAVHDSPQIAAFGIQSRAYAVGAIISDANRPRLTVPPPIPTSLNPLCSVLSIFLYLIPRMSHLLRSAMSSSLRQPSVVATQRVAQLSRQFGSTSSARQQVQDAYILSAARTPTAKVCIANFMPTVCPDVY